MGYTVIVTDARYSEYTESDYAYQRACFWWMRLAQVAYLCVWAWTLCGMMMLARVVLW